MRDFGANFMHYAHLYSPKYMQHILDEFAFGYFAQIGEIVAKDFRFFELVKIVKRKIKDFKASEKGNVDDDDLLDGDAKAQRRPYPSDVGQ
ncbi:hypothetical protein Ancab_016247 [Ancistrocladus abbreviatus]